MIDLNKVKPSDLWYTIGYIAADGHLSKDGRHIDITSKDRAHLYSIRSALHLKNKIGRKSRSAEKAKLYSKLQFGDVKFYKYLLSLGFTQQKSLNLGVIQVNSEFFIDFLRGVMDADGNISTWRHNQNGNQQWCSRIYSASPAFVQWLNKRIKEQFGIEGKVSSQKSNNSEHPLYRIKFGWRATKVILRQIYYPGCLSLERKVLQAQECLQ